MIIIFEGVDKIGKTTLLKQLASWMLDMPVQILTYGRSFHNVQTSHKDLLQYQASTFADMFNLLEDRHQISHFLLDRSHIGEWVYGQLYRHYIPGYLWKLEELHKHLPIQVIYLYANPQWIQNNRNQKQSFINIEKEQILFFDAIKRTLFPTLSFDVSIGDPEEILPQVINKLGVKRLVF